MTGDGYSGTGNTATRRTAGRVLADRYTLDRMLGAGGMGEVWAAHDAKLGRQVAIKLIRGRFAGDAVAVRRLEREARAAALLNDEHVLTVHDIVRVPGPDPLSGEGDGDDRDTIFIVMALAKGRDLGELLHDNGRVAPALAVEWARQISLALAAAHRAGIVHRDIKPTNIMVDLPAQTPAHTPALVTVLDFGIAHFDGSHDMSRLGTEGMVGSISWMAPEQAAGGPIDHRADLYSLGCLLYQLLTGSPPFGDRGLIPQLMAHASERPVPPAARRPCLPAALDDLVMALLAKDPDDRPASAADVARRLEALAPDLPPPDLVEVEVTAEVVATGDEADRSRPAAGTGPRTGARTGPRLRPLTVSDRGLSRRAVLTGLGIAAFGGTTARVLLAPEHSSADNPRKPAAPLGTLLWQQPLGAADQLAGVWNDVAILKRDGRYTGIGVADGKKDWDFPLSGESGQSGQSGASGDSAPAPGPAQSTAFGADGSLYIATWNTVRRVYTGPDPAGSSQTLWSYPFDDAAVPAGGTLVNAGESPITALSLNGELLFVAQRNFVTALAARNGSVAWSWLLKSDLAQSVITGLVATDDELVIHEGRADIFTGSSSQQIHCLEIGGRKPLWRAVSSGPGYRSADRLLVGDWGPAGLSLIRPSDGVMMWGSRGRTTVAGFLPEVGVFVTRSGVDTLGDPDATTSEIAVRSLADGSEQWKFEAERAVPVGVASRPSGKCLIFAVVQDGRKDWATMAFDVTTGAMSWRAESTYPFELGGGNSNDATRFARDAAPGATAPSHWIPVRLLDAGRPTIAALDPTTGAALWQFSVPYGDLDTLIMEPKTGRVLILTVNHDGKSLRGTPQELYCIE